VPPHARVVRVGAPRGLGKSLRKGSIVGGNKDVKATIVELVLAFPAAFTGDTASVRPLKLGIKEDLYAKCDMSHRRITAALRSYCNSVDYLMATAQGAVRIDLDGRPAGIVTEAEAEHAMEALALTKAAGKRSSKAAGGVRAEAPLNNSDTRKPSPPHPTTAAPKPSRSVGSARSVNVAVAAGPPRSSLADLRKSAAARKAKG
jgi:ProP effector